MTKRRETWAVTKPVFTLLEPKSRPPRSQSTRSSEETGKPEWSKGVQEGGDAMTEPTENKPEAVPERATRDGEILLRWGWVEPRVWTERMLTALQSGVKGGRWFSLIDKVHPVRTLDAAFNQVAGNKGAAGVDRVTVEGFELRLAENLKKLSEDLRSGNYQPQQIRRHYIPKPGTKEKRPLGIPICRSYCTSLQRRWGLKEVQLITELYLSDEIDCRDQERRVGLRKPAMISDVSLIHQGP
jgi:hypothetical protein